MTFVDWVCSVLLFHQELRAVLGYVKVRLNE